MKTEVNSESLKKLSYADYKKALKKDKKHLKKAGGVVLMNDYKFADGKKGLAVLLFKKPKEVKTCYKEMKASGHPPLKMAGGSCELVDGQDGKELKIDIKMGGLKEEKIAQKGKALFKPLLGIIAKIVAKDPQADDGQLNQQETNEVNDLQSELNTIKTQFAKVQQAVNNFKAGQAQQEDADTIEDVVASLRAWLVDFKNATPDIKNELKAQALQLKDRYTKLQPLVAKIQQQADEVDPKTLWEKIKDGAEGLVDKVTDVVEDIFESEDEAWEDENIDEIGQGDGTAESTESTDSTEESPEEQESETEDESAPLDTPLSGSIPAGYVPMKNSEVTSELSELAVHYLNVFTKKYPKGQRQEHYGEYILFKTKDGKEFLARFEIHTKYGANPDRPEKPHPSIGLMKKASNDDMVVDTNTGDEAGGDVSIRPIAGSVGAGGTNNPDDVAIIKTLLNQKINAGLTPGNSNVGPKTIAAIEKFQSEVGGFGNPDGRVDPGGTTWRLLSQGATAPVEEEPADPTPEPTEPTESSDDTAGEDSAGDDQPAPLVQPNSSLSAAVGANRPNVAGDVAAVQYLLNKEAGTSFVVDGVFTDELSQAIIDFQKNELGFSKPDGVVDPGGTSWRGLNGQKPGDPPPGPVNKPNWIKIAEGEIGTKEVVGANHNPKVIEYHSTTGGFKDDETPWCSSFVNWVMGKAGYTGTNSAAAVSWKSWGNDVGEPAYGAIAVIDWDGPGPGWKGHVGFVVGKQGNSVLLLGGNQANAVNVKKFGTNNIMAYVYPSNFEVPQNFLTFGEAEGNFGGGGDVNSTR